MAKKSKKQSNRKQNIQTARHRAATRARVPAKEAVEQPVRVVETAEAVPAGTPDDIIEITELPQDPLAGEAIVQMAETTDSQVAEAAAEAVAAEAEAAAADAPITESPAEGIEITSQENADALLATTHAEEPASKEPVEESIKSKRRIPIWGKVLIGVAVALAVVLAVGIGFVSHFLSRIGRASDEDYVAEAVSEDAVDETSDEVDADDTMDPNDIVWYGQTIEPIDDEDIKNILLIGQDRREGDSKSELKRSDAMVIISLNQATGKIKVCSLMRDMYVQIPGYGGNKLNYSYEKGGMELLDQTIEENLGVTIDNNVELDFDGFVEAMSVVGNLDIYLSQAEIDFMEAHPTWADDSGADVTTWDLHEGLNSMTPSEYAVFCRLRMIGNNDFERTERQRRVLSAAFNKVIEGGVFNMLSVANAIIPYITTDMSNGEILSYVYTVFTKGMELSGQYRIPLDNTWTNQTINRAAVLVCDMETNTKALQEFLYGDEEGVEFTSEEERAQQKEDGTFTTDSYGSVTSSGSSSSYSSYSSSGSSSSSTATTDTTATEQAVDETQTPVVDDTTIVTDPTAVDGTSVTTDPTVVTDPTGTATGTTTDAAADQAAIDAANAAAAQAAAEQAAAAQAAAQAAAAQAVADQTAAAQAAAAQAAAEQAAAAAAAAAAAGTTTP